MARHDELWIPELDEKKWPKYLAVTVAFAAAVVGVFLLISSLRPKEVNETERGMQRLKELESQSVTDAQTAITSLRTTADNTSDKKKRDVNNTSLQIKFSDADIVMVGDSLTAALIDYGILDATQAVGKKGASVAEHSDLMSRVYQEEPWNFVACYGLDDLAKYGADVDAFLEAYESLLREYISMRPSSDVYVCGIPGVSTEAVEKNPNFRYLNIYNEGIRRLCKRMRLYYIDTEDLVREYSQDGILPAYEFYTPWIERIVTKVTGEEISDQPSVLDQTTEDTSDEENGEAQDAEEAEKGGTIDTDALSEAEAAQAAEDAENADGYYDYGYYDESYDGGYYEESYDDGYYEESY